MKRQIGNHTRNTDPALAPPVQLTQLQSRPWRSTIESLDPELETSEVEEAEPVQAKFGHNLADIPFSEPDPPPAEPNTSVPNVQADFERELNQAKTGGSPLDNAFREKVEPAMGADFSGVKVHTDARADQLSQSIQAKAFTTGNDIFFKQGEYEPGSQQGQELLAHELTHVVQQSGETHLNKLPDERIQGNIPGTYSTQIKWGIHLVDARPIKGKGFWGKRIRQSDARVDAFELKINPNNESFYVPHPDGGYVQFENLSNNLLQDGKLIKKVKGSIYHVYDKPEFLRKKILEEATRQISAASSNGLSVEWLVSDHKAVEQLTQFFKEKTLILLLIF